MSIGKFLTGFLVGSAVGGIVGLLLAPSSGEDTREIIAEKSKEMYRNTGDSVKEIQCRANEVIEDIQKKGDELLSKIQDVIKKEQHS
ncbi:MAG TPA: YtxH domain-containing protein [Candidatus Gastranaerophilales bacterium]|nr:YtxH domain-containing protein [Candidatus Gastranaerophilales bacterium]